jgi:translation initiation factor eIF-2B subunit epsilon
MASNVPLGRVREFVIPYILSRCDGTNVSETIARWGGLVANLTGEGEDAMKDCLLIAQKFVAERAMAGAAPDLRFFLRVLRGFYDEDVVSDEAAFAWYKSVEARSVGGEAGRTLWAGSKPFLEALAEDSDDEEEEEDDESE